MGIAYGFKYDDSKVSFCKKEVEGWFFEEDGKEFFSGSEYRAKTSAAVARVCDTCGEEYDLDYRYTNCPKCMDKEREEEFSSMEEVEWDGNTPVIIHDSDTYFNDESDLIDYCRDNGNVIPDLVLCQPVKLQTVGDDDILPWCHDDTLELCNDVAEALENLNKAIQEFPNSGYWEPANKRIRTAWLERYLRGDIPDRQEKDILALQSK